MKTTKNSPELSNVEKDFIDKLKGVLEKRGMKPVHLARRLGLSDGWISNIMRYRRGSRALTIKLLYDIAEKLDVDPASLLPDVKNPKTKIDFEEWIRSIIKDEIDKDKQEK